MLHLQEFGKCRLETETGGIAIDFLHELAHLHERFREKGKRENGQMCSLQLIGAEALILEFISFSEAAALTSNPVQPGTGNLLLFIIIFLDFRPVLLCSHLLIHYFLLWFLSFVYPTLVTLFFVFRH